MRDLVGAPRAVLSATLGSVRLARRGHHHRKSEMPVDDDILTFVLGVSLGLGMNDDDDDGDDDDDLCARRA